MEEKGLQKFCDVVESDGRLKISIDNVQPVWYNQTDPSHYWRPDGIEMRRRKFKTKKR